MANTQIQAYLMCYFHVNAIPSITVATQVIDRAGEVGGDRKERGEKC